MTRPGMGPLTALAFVLIIGTPQRFRRGKQIGSYVGFIPSEDSSAGYSGDFSDNLFCTGFEVERSLFQDAPRPF